MWQELLRREQSIPFRSDPHERFYLLSLCQHPPSHAQGCVHFFPLLPIRCLRSCPTLEERSIARDRRLSSCQPTQFPRRSFATHSLEQVDISQQVDPLSTTSDTIDPAIIHRQTCQVDSSKRTLLLQPRGRKVPISCVAIRNSFLPPRDQEDRRQLGSTRTLNHDPSIPCKWCRVSSTCKHAQGLPVPPHDIKNPKDANHLPGHPVNV